MWRLQLPPFSFLHHSFLLFSLLSSALARSVFTTFFSFVAWSSHDLNFTQRSSYRAQGFRGECYGYSSQNAASYTAMRASIQQSKRSLLYFVLLSLAFDKLFSVFGIFPFRQLGVVGVSLSHSQQVFWAITADFDRRTYIE